MSLLRKIPERIKTKIKYLLTGANHPDYVSLHKDEPKIFVFLAGFYQNLGDMAITYAQKEFLQNLYPERKVICVASTQTYSALKTIKKKVGKEDIITLIGGGNMDDKYQSLEDARLFVVQQFPKNKMISFPQTVCFSDTKKGRKSFKRSRRIYSKHEDLTMFMRENNAFLRAKTYFPKVNVMPCPDIVLYLNETTPKTERTNILCCLRKDKEQNISNEAREELISYMTKNYENVLCKDTVDVALEDCRINTYEKTLKEFWATLRTCKLVITDRLHCMIFCAITETPCIVMDNTNKKISGVCRQWLSGADWIKMVEGCDRQKIVELADEMLGKESVCKSVNLEEAFKPLKQVCRNN